MTVSPSNESCPSNWHWSSAHKGVQVTFTRSWRHVSAEIPWDVAIAAGLDPWNWDECPTKDQVRRCLHPAQASRRHPAIKPNRRRTHRH